MAKIRFFPPTKAPTVREIGEWTGAALAEGADGEIRVQDVAAIDAAGVGDLTFLDNPRYLPHLSATRAAAVFVAPRHIGDVPAGCVALSTPQPPAPPQQPAQQPQQQPQASPTQPQRPAQQTVAQPPPAASPGYAPPEPDITIKYHVMLGLPAGLPPPASTSTDKPGDGVDATASTAANIESSLIAEFRRHLRTCSRLPAEIVPSDNVMIKLRSLMAPDGTLAAEPILIEASASAKGALLMQGAISALRACQPYTMLPKDRYGEWKVIDLVFTPRDFAG